MNPKFKVGDKVCRSKRYQPTYTEGTIIKIDNQWSRFFYTVNWKKSGIGEGWHEENLELVVEPNDILKGLL